MASGLQTCSCTHTRGSDHEIAPTVILKYCAAPCSYGITVVMPWNGHAVYVLADHTCEKDTKQAKQAVSSIRLTDRCRDWLIFSCINQAGVADMTNRYIPLQSRTCRNKACVRFRIVFINCCFVLLSLCRFLCRFTLSLLLLPQLNQNRLASRLILLIGIGFLSLCNLSFSRFGKSVTTGIDWKNGCWDIF